MQHVSVRNYRCIGHWDKSLGLINKHYEIVKWYYIQAVVAAVIESRNN